MSISSTPPHEPANKLEQLAVNPIRPVPALDKKAEAPAAAPKSQAAAPAPQPAEATPAADKPAAGSSKPQKKRINWAGIALDTALVLMVVGVLAGGAFYLHSQWEQYRVPTQLELLNQECLELCAKREAMQDQANEADRQLHMRQKLISLDERLKEISEDNARVTASIAEQKKLVLALQHEIRRADREARTVARGLLPGLQIGDVSTTRGKVYENASISRIDGRRIYLRTPYGAASFPINELVKDNLPDMVLYALGIIDLVNTSDFTASGAAPTTPQKKNTKLRTQVKPLKPSDYEPRKTGPVLDTNGNKTSIHTSDGPGSASGDSWQPPTGDLPL
ncbi:MAG: hypothetical protein J1E42_04080 [Akkermansiaceae bacterium]|nr:hypothetical protein [Akkermansiaceae bacterium]